MMLNIYYNNRSDYDNKNRFYDFLEKNSSNAVYNSFVSTSSVDLFYKENDRLETIRFDMPDFIPLAVTKVGLKPNTFLVSKNLTNSITITYYTESSNATNTPIINRN